MDISDLDIASLQDAMDSGQLTAVSLTESYLERIESIDRRHALRAVITTNPEALPIARQLDLERANGALRGPLHGIPVLIKDNIDTGDAQPTTAGSLALAGQCAPRDATLVARLREAGAVVLGKTNLSEWSNWRSPSSSSGWSAVGGQTRNPYVLDRTPCGSSSGSAVAVSASLAPIAVGTETDGSIVMPASMNGIVGFKPTVGMVSRTGIAPISHSQDTAGPMARTVADAALLFHVLAGNDRADPVTWRADTHRQGLPQALCGASLEGRRIGIARGLGGNDVRVGHLLDATIDTLRREGAEVIDPVDINGGYDYAADEMVVMSHEAREGISEYLRNRGIPGLGSLADVIRFNEREAALEMRWWGQELLLLSEATDGLKSQRYLEAKQRAQRRAGAEGIDATLFNHRLDAIVAVTSGPAFTIDVVNGDNGGSMLSCARPAAVAGYPHITVPAGFVHGLPVGVSFMASAWQDAKLLGLAHAFERAHGARRPPQFQTTIHA